MLRLFETSIPGWLPLRAGNAIQHIPREIKMVPCRGFLARAGHAGSTIDLQIANMHRTPQLMVMRGLAHWRDNMRNDLVLGKDKIVVVLVFRTAEDVASIVRQPGSMALAKSWHAHLLQSNQQRAMTVQHWTCHPVTHLPVGQGPGWSAASYVFAREAARSKAVCRAFQPNVQLAV